MNTQTTLDRLKPILADLLLIEEDTITAESTIESLVADSLDVTELVLCIEDEWLMKTPEGFEEKLQLCETVEDMVKAIEEAAL